MAVKAEKAGRSDVMFFKTSSLQAPLAKSWLREEDNNSGFIRKGFIEAAAAAAAKNEGEAGSVGSWIGAGAAALDAKDVFDEVEVTEGVGEASWRGADSLARRDSADGRLG